MKIYYTILICSLGILVLFTAGCASMSKEECRTATRDTWVSVGYDDGRHGRSENNIRNHQKACAGITSPDLAAYQQGHARGVAEYCVESTGYAVGLHGRPENSVCAGGEFRGYHEAHRVAIDIYRSETEISQLTQELQHAYQARADAEYDIKVVESELVSEGISTRERKRLLIQSKQMRDDLQNYDISISEAENALQRAINAHNRKLPNNPFEKRQPLKMPTITVEERPDPRPRREAHKEHRHHDDRARDKLAIKAEAFIIDSQVKDVMHKDPHRLIKRHLAHPVGRDDNHQQRQGGYQLFRFPNKGSMTIRWTGYAKRGHQISLSYWNGRGYVTEIIRNEQHNHGYVTDVDVPPREKYVYVLIGSKRGRVVTEKISARLKPEDRSRNSHL